MAERNPVQVAILREARRQRALRLKRASQERWRFRMRRLRRAFLSLAAILVATIAAGFVFGGLPDGTYVLVMLLALVTFFMLAIYPSTPRPRAEDLQQASLPELAGSTELWLETRRRALPSPALDTIDLIGARLENVPLPDTLADAALPRLLDDDDARQVLHVTFGSALDALGAELKALLTEHSAEHEEGLARHFERHLTPFVPFARLRP